MANLPEPRKGLRKRLISRRSVQLLAFVSTTPGLVGTRRAPRLQHLDLSGSTELADDCVDVLGRFPDLKSVGLVCRASDLRRARQRLQDRLPEATVHHPGLPTRSRRTDALCLDSRTEGNGGRLEGRAIGWLLTEVPPGTSASSLLNYRVTEVPSSGPERLAPLRGIGGLVGIGLKNADEQTESLGHLNGLFRLNLPGLRSDRCRSAPIDHVIVALHESALPGVRRSPTREVPFQTFMELTGIWVSPERPSRMPDLIPIGKLPPAGDIDPRVVPRS